MFHPDGPTLFELARQAFSSTERGYDLLASKFDHTPFRTPEPIVQAAAEEIGEVNDALDVCCGTGVGLLALAPLVKRRLVGVDVSRGMLEVARQGVHAEGDCTLELLRHDATALPFRDAFDAITCFGAFGHIVGADETPFLTSIHQALRPGGRFVFASATEPPTLSMASLLSRGFNAVMHVRNALIQPPFIMYYLTFMLPQVEQLLRDHQFDVTVRNPALAAPFQRVRIVVATRQGGIA